MAEHTHATPTSTPSLSRRSEIRSGFVAFADVSAVGISADCVPALRISFRRALRRSSPAVLRVRRLERGIEPDLFSLRLVNNASTQQLEPGTAIHGLFSIFRRFICSSNGLVIHGRSSAAWMAPMSRRRPAANSHVAAVWLSIALCTWCRPN